MRSCASRSRAVVGCYWLFFFSSRRRHTRSLCDWSSDVCSSDLNQRLAKAEEGQGSKRKIDHPHARGMRLLILLFAVTPVAVEPTAKPKRHFLGRSEERRVGKECRSRSSQYQAKKN